VVGTARGWMDELEVLYSRMARRFARSEPRRRALSYLRGLTGGLERKNGWQLAEAASERTPDGMDTFGFRRLGSQEGLDYFP
jgi:hypothetical protein